MKFYSSHIAACCLAFSTLAFSTSAFSDFQLSGSLSSPNSEGNVGFVSDVSNSEAQYKVFEDVGLYKDSVVKEVNWMGSEIPTDSTNTPLMFTISFHEELYDANRTPVRTYPNVTPFATRTVEATIVETGVGVPGTRVNYSATFDMPVEIVGFERGIWMSIALESPNADNFEWEWSRANGLGMSYQQNINNGELNITGGDVVYGIYGLYYAPPMIDSDGDGVFDQYDECHNTSVISDLDHNGCSDYQRDSDEDGFSDDIDQCPQTLPDAPVDFEGCAADQADYDSDGAVNVWDDCLATPAGETVNIDGCSEEQLGQSYEQFYNNLFSNIELSPMAVVSDTSAGTIAYGMVTMGPYAQNADRIRWVGTALPDNVEANFTITHHIAIPEGHLKPWTYPWSTFDLIAERSEPKEITVNGETTQVQVFTATLPSSFQFLRFYYNHFSIQFINSETDGFEEEWSWFGNENATGYSNIGTTGSDDTTLINGRLYMSLSVAE